MVTGPVKAARAILGVRAKVRSARVMHARSSSVTRRNEPGDALDAPIAYSGGPSSRGRCARGVAGPRTRRLSRGARAAPSSVLRRGRGRKSALTKESHRSLPRTGRRRHRRGHSSRMGVVASRDLVVHAWSFRRIARRHRVGDPGDALAEPALGQPAPGQLDPRGHGLLVRPRRRAQSSIGAVGLGDRRGGASPSEQGTSMRAVTVGAFGRPQGDEVEVGAVGSDGARGQQRQLVIDGQVPRGVGRHEQVHGGPIADPDQHVEQEQSPEPRVEQDARPVS